MCKLKRLDFVSARVAVSSPISEFILRITPENIVMRKLHYTVPLNKRIYFIINHGIREILENKFA